MSVPREISLSVDAVESTVSDLSVADRMFPPFKLAVFDTKEYSTQAEGLLVDFPFERQFNLSYTDSKNVKY